MPTISVTWADAALQAIRNLGSNPSPIERARIGPPMVARSLAILHTAMYDTWAIYNPQASRHTYVSPANLLIPMRNAHAA